MSASKRAAFILIDHTISGEGGHYLEYARNVLDAAARDGYRPVLVTNRAFAPAADLQCEVHRLYERDMWGRKPGRAAVPRRARALGGRPSSDLVVSILSLASAVTTVAARAVSHWLRVRSFALDTRRLMRQLAPGRDDIIFIPSLSESDLWGLARCFRSEPTSALPAWHLLFRREIFGRRLPSYDTDRDLVRRIRRYLLKRGIVQVLSSRPRHRVRFHTDTERLVDQYQRLGVVDFNSLPVPVSPRLRSRAPRQFKRPLVVAYLGDARAEKGYDLLPLITDALLPELRARKVRFVIQSNLGFVDASREAAVVRARERLRAQSEYVTLHEAPLESSAYADVLLGSDLVVIPYAAEPYYARSSSVLVEALSAGLPVVVPAASWMGDFIQSETSQYHEMLLRKIPARGEPDYCWRRKSGQPIDSNQDEFTFGRGSFAACCSITLARRGGHVLVQIPVAPTIDSGRYVRVSASFTAASGDLISSDERILAASKPPALTALFTVPPMAERAELRLSNAFERMLIVVPQPRVHVLATTGVVGLESLGRTFVSSTQIPNALREMLGAYEAYRERTAEFSRRSQLSESAALLVTRLEEESAKPRDQVAESA
jgi:hypothetical protein